MSRIEIAMEKAARLREGKGTAIPDLPSPAPSAAEGLAPAPADHPAPEPASSSPPAAKARPLPPTNPFLVNLHDPQSGIAEEYRKLKLALVEIATAEHAFRNCVLVTSSVPSEGKSLTALNLAMSLAQELDHTVLVIDADLRKPALHRYLEIEPGVGLSDLLLDKAQLKEVVIDTGIAKLSIIRAGTSIDNPGELFSSAKMKNVIEQLKRSYPDRFLIFDTPPVLPFAETRSLARLMDGVLFVVMERMASQANVREALESLNGSHILGTVYNAALLGTHEERYSHYQGYYRRGGQRGSGQPPSSGASPADKKQAR